MSTEICQCGRPAIPGRQRRYDSAEYLLEPRMATMSDRSLYEHLGIRARAGERGRTERTAAIETIDRDRHLLDSASRLLGAPPADSLYAAFSVAAPPVTEPDRTASNEATGITEHDRPRSDFVAP
jgi:hypothetical protein